MFVFTDTTPALHSRRTALAVRSKLIALFVACWALQIATLAGLLGPLMQGVGAALFALWLLHIAVLWKVGFLPTVGRFWLSVFRGR